MTDEDKAAVARVTELIKGDKDGRASTMRQFAKDIVADPDGLYAQGFPTQLIQAAQTLNALADQLAPKLTP